MSKRLFLLGIEHEGASRLPGKPLLPFKDTTLFDILLEKFEALQDSGIFCGVGMALWQGDRKLCARAALRHPGIPIIARSEASVNAHNDLRAQFGFLKHIDAEYVLWPNTCAPLLKASTIHEMAKKFTALPEWEGWDGVTTVIGRRSWFWDPDTHRPIGRHAMASQEMQPVFESTYNVHLFRPETVLEDGRYWTYDGSSDPHLWVMPDPIETMDIDTPEDFKRAEEAFPEMGTKEYRAIVELPKETPCARQS